MPSQSLHGRSFGYHPDAKLRKRTQYIPERNGQHKIKRRSLLANMKKLLGLLVFLSAFGLNAATVILQWDYDFSVNPDVVSFKIYAVPGVNTEFTPGNANATRSLVLPIPAPVPGIFTPDIRGTLSGIATGPWTFTVTAIDSAGIESENATPVSATIRPGKPTRLLIP